MALAVRTVLRRAPFPYLVQLGPGAAIDILPGDPNFLLCDDYKRH